MILMIFLSLTNRQLSRSHSFSIFLSSTRLDCHSHPPHRMNCSRIAAQQLITTTDATGFADPCAFSSSVFHLVRSAPLLLFLRPTASALLCLAFLNLIFCLHTMVIAVTRPNLSFSAILLSKLVQLSFRLCFVRSRHRGRFG